MGKTEAVDIIERITDSMSSGWGIFSGEKHLKYGVENI